MIEFDDRQLLVGDELLKVKLFDICGSKKKKKKWLPEFKSIPKGKELVVSLNRPVWKSYCCAIWVIDRRLVNAFSTLNSLEWSFEFFRIDKK